jgi:glycosyltransferase involved in cell wall biosynthesis
MTTSTITPACPVPVSVILPAFDEETGVAREVSAIRGILDEHAVTHEIVVVDDGSRDRTAEEALGAGARVLRHQDNRGYGAAIKSGIAAARHDTCVIIDADNTYPADEIPALLAELETADMVVGARTRGTANIPRARRPGKWLLTGLAERIAGQPIDDLNSGLRAFRRECVVQYFPILPNRFSFTTTVTLAYLADDYRIVYHPIEYRRRTGTSKIRPRHFLDFVVLVLRMALLFQPLKIFAPLALGAGLLGLAKVALDITGLFARTTVRDWSLLFQPTLSTSAILLLLLALQLLLVGMVADGVLRRIAQRNRPLAPSHGVWAREATPPEAPDATEGLR